MVIMDKARRRAAVRRSVRRHVEDADNLVIPPCRNPCRRKRALASLWQFGMTYWREEFSSPFGDCHKNMVAVLDATIREGGQHAEVMPRGSAKTTWAEIGAIYALLSGARRFVAIVAGTGEDAERMLEHIKADLESNEKLGQDFPEVCFPIEAIDGSFQRAKSMRVAGHPIPFVWQSKRVILPPVPGSLAAGGIIMARGIEGNIRGLLHKARNGRRMRPDLILIDDPQTRESANSPHQVFERIQVINGDILGLAGPRRKIAAMCAGTIIARNDVMDQLTDTRANPSWQGSRTAMVRSWAKRHEDLWLTQYADLRRQGQRDGDAHGQAATEFYRAHKADMDEGADVYWEARHDEHEISGIQSAYNLLIDRGEHVFASEYQGQPKDRVAASWVLEPEQVAARLSRVERGVVPDGCTIVTLGADVNLYGIHWVVGAYSPEAAGFVLDYGKYPSGDAPLWSEKAPYTEEAAIVAGIHAVCDDVLGRRVYRAKTGERIIPAAACFDAGYKRDAVAMATVPMRGRYGMCQIFPIRALSTKGYRPLNAQRKGDGWHLGEFGRHRCMYCNADVWRERMQRGFLLPVGSPQSLSLYGDIQSVHAHLAEHIAAERIVDVLTGDKLGMVYVWALLPGRKNDLADALTYSCAASSYCGILWEPNAAKRSAEHPTAQKRQLTPAEIAQRKAASVRPRPGPMKRGFVGGTRPGGFVGGWH